MDRRALQATVHGVTKSRTRLSDWTATTSFPVLSRGHSVPKDRKVALASFSPRSSFSVSFSRSIPPIPPCFAIFLNQSLLKLHLVWWCFIMQYIITIKVKNILLLQNYKGYQLSHWNPRKREYSHAFTLSRSCQINWLLWWWCIRNPGQSSGLSLLQSTFGQGGVAYTIFLYKKKNPGD